MRGIIVSNKKKASALALGFPFLLFILFHNWRLLYALNYCMIGALFFGLILSRIVFHFKSRTLLKQKIRHFFTLKVKQFKQQAHRVYGFLLRHGILIQGMDDEIYEVPQEQRMEELYNQFFNKNEDIAAQSDIIDHLEQLSNQIENPVFPKPMFSFIHEKEVGFTQLSKDQRSKPQNMRKKNIQIDTDDEEIIEKAPPPKVVGEKAPPPQIQINKSEPQQLKPPNLAQPIQQNVPSFQQTSPQNQVPQPSQEPIGTFSNGLLAALSTQPIQLAPQTETPKLTFGRPVIQITPSTQPQTRPQPVEPQPQSRPQTQPQLQQQPQTQPSIPPPAQQQQILQQQPQLQQSSHIQQGSIFSKYLGLSEKLDVKEALLDRETAQIYKSVFQTKRIQRKQASTLSFLQMIPDPYLKFLDVMKQNRQHQFKLACVFVEEHLHFFILYSIGQRKQNQKDKLIHIFIFLLKTLSAQSAEGRLLFTVAVTIITKKLFYLFQSSPTQSLNEYQEFFEKVFYTDSIQEIPPTNDKDQMYLSQLRKYSMLLFGLLWIDPNNHIPRIIIIILKAEATEKWVSLRLKSYSQQVLKEDRTTFLEYTKLLITNAKNRPNFVMVPAFMAIFSVMNDAVYDSAIRTPNDVQQSKNLLSVIMNEGSCLLRIPKDQTIELQNGKRLQNTTQCLKEFSQRRDPAVAPEVIKVIHDELFHLKYVEQKGCFEILKTYIDIAKGVIDRRSETYNDYNFFNALYKSEASADFYVS